MSKFAFIVHPTELRQIHKWQPWSRVMPFKITAKMLQWSPPFEISHIKNVRSITGREVEGYLIACPLLPHQILKLNEGFVINKIVAAGKIAEKLGAKIVGLGAYTSVVGDKGITIAKQLDTAVTTGNSYTVSLVKEAVLEAARLKGIKLPEATAAIIGATGSIGSACAQILAQYISRIIITARNQEVLRELALLLRKNYPVVVEIEEDAKKAVSNADIVITASSSPSALINIENLKPGAVACDVAIPKNISLKNKEKRKDVLVFEGGLAKMPQKVDFGIDIGLPPGIIYACMAETISLALEGRFEDYSLGQHLSLEKIEEVVALTSKHGFTLWYNGFDKQALISYGQKN